MTEIKTLSKVLTIVSGNTKWAPELSRSLKEAFFWAPKSWLPVTNAQLCLMLASQALVTLTCFSSSTVVSGLLPFLSFCTSWMAGHCLVCWPWVSPFLSPLLFSPWSLDSSSYYPLCPTSLLIPLLSSFWPVSFLLDQSGTLGRQGKTTMLLYISK